jgi:quercetin dioxygenase-like cupin family protein
MKKSVLLSIFLAVAGVHMAAGQQSTDTGPEGVVRAGSQKGAPGPASFFTGQVLATPLVAPQPGGRSALALVSFQPGAHSNWHTHPGGQILYVTDGCGWTQREGGPIALICKGDSAYVPAGLRHWHGATSTTGMSHLSVAEVVDGRNVDWMEPVSDAQYGVGPTPPK